MRLYTTDTLEAIKSLVRKFGSDALTLAQCEKLEVDWLEERTRQQYENRVWPASIAVRLDEVGYPGGSRVKFYRWLRENGYLVDVESLKAGFKVKEPTSKAFEEGYAIEFESSLIKSFEWTSSGLEALLKMFDSKWQKPHRPSLFNVVG